MKARQSSAFLRRARRIFSTTSRRFSRLSIGFGGGRLTQGRVIAKTDIESALADVGLKPDFEISEQPAGSDVPFLHRQLPDGVLYFLVNRRNQSASLEARFRVTNKTPEIWHADTRKIEPLSYRIAGDETVVPLSFDAEESYFVVFRKAAAALRQNVLASSVRPAATLAGPWTVAFQPGRGAPTTTQQRQLGSLSEDADAAIRFFPA
jgi:hypothetical protein